MTNGFHKRTGKSDQRPAGRKNQPAGKGPAKEKLTSTPRDGAAEATGGSFRTDRASG